MSRVIINFDNFPAPTLISTQYAPHGVIFSSDSPAGFPVVDASTAEASSLPNLLVGSVVNTAGIYSIVMDFRDFLPSSVAMNVISAGTAIATVTAFASDQVTVLDTVYVTHGLGAGNGFGNVDPITLFGPGIARVRFEITQTTSTVDGIGIDDLAFHPANSVPDSATSGYLLIIGMGALAGLRRRSLTNLIQQIETVDVASRTRV